MMNSRGKANEVDIRQRGQVDAPSDEGKGELLDSPYHHSSGILRQALDVHMHMRMYCMY